MAGAKKAGHDWRLPSPSPKWSERRVGWCWHARGVSIPVWKQGYRDPRGDQAVPSPLALNFECKPSSHSAWEEKALQKAGFCVYFSHFLIFLQEKWKNIKKQKWKKSEKVAYFREKVAYFSVPWVFRWFCAKMKVKKKWKSGVISWKSGVFSRTLSFVNFARFSASINAGILLPGQGFLGLKLSPMISSDELRELRTRQWSCSTLSRGISYLDEQRRQVKQETMDVDDQLKVSRPHWNKKIVGF